MKKTAKCTMFCIDIACIHDVLLEYRLIAIQHTITI